MTQEQADQWAKTRLKGRWHFIMVTGVFVWGGVTALIWSAFLSVFSEQGFMGALTLALPLCLVGGFSWGLLTWTLTNRRYKKYSATQDEIE